MSQNIAAKSVPEEEINRQIRHAVKEYFPKTRLSLSAVSAAAAVFVPQPAVQACCAGLSGLFALSAARSLAEDAPFWKPALHQWLRSSKPD